MVNWKGKGRKGEWEKITGRGGGTFALWGKERRERKKKERIGKDSEQRFVPRIILI